MCKLRWWGNPVCATEVNCKWLNLIASTFWSSLFPSSTHVQQAMIALYYLFHVSEKLRFWNDLRFYHWARSPLQSKQGNWKVYLLQGSWQIARTLLFYHLCLGCRLILLLINNFVHGLSHRWSYRNRENSPYSKWNISTVRSMHFSCTTELRWEPARVSEKQ